MTTSLEVDCYRDRGFILLSIISGVVFLLRRRRFDVIVLTGGDIRNFIWFSLARLITSARIVIRFGGDPSSVRRSMQQSARASGNKLRYYRGALGYWATRFMLKRVDGIIAVSRQLADSIAPLTGSGTRFCVSEPVIRCEVTAVDKADNDRGQVRLCTVTNLNYREKAEGVVFTIKALVECCSSFEPHREIIFDIVGGGRSLDYLKREIESIAAPGNLKIFLHGYQENVSGFYARADVFVYNSTLDSYPLVLVEATANGLPIVLNDWGAFPELYQNEVSALIYETGNADALIRVLRRLLNDRELMKTLGEGSRRQYQSNSLENSGIELERFIREVV